MARLTVSVGLWGVILLAALGGALTSGLLLAGHGGGWDAPVSGGSSVSSLCRTPDFPSASCAEVVDSRWGSFDFYWSGHRVLVPTSLIGLSYFLAVLIWFGLMGRLPGDARWLWRITMLLVVGGLVGSIFLLTVMFRSLPTWCPLCLAAHGMNLIVVMGSVWLWRRSKRKIPSTTGAMEEHARCPALGRFRLACAALALTAMSSVALQALFDASYLARRQGHKLNELSREIAELQKDRSLMLHAYLAQPVVEIPPLPDASGSRRDSADGSPPTLVIFSHYACRPCACLERNAFSLFDVVRRNGVRVEYRLVPGVASRGATSAGRNPRADLPGTIRASRAAEAARLQGGNPAFLVMHDELLEHRANLNAIDVASIARSIGLDPRRLVRDMDSEPVTRRLAEDAALADRLGVESVPVLFLAGRRVPDICIGSPVFWRAITEVLRERRAVTDVSVWTDQDGTTR